MLQQVMDPVRQEAARVRHSGALGRSPQLVELFDFFVENAARQSRIKEHEIAQAVFGRSADFEPGQDALVRVQVHRLRGKLDAYYAGLDEGDGRRLTIPRGEYRLVLEQAAPEEEEAPAPIPPVPPAPVPRWRAMQWWPVAALVALIMVIAVILWPHTLETPAQRSALWRDLSAMNRTTLVFMGTTGAGAGGHETLPFGSAGALRLVIPVLSIGERGQRMRMLPVSQFSPDMLRAADIVYIGRLQDLGLFRGPLLAGTRLGRNPRFRAAFEPSIEAQATEDQYDLSYVASFPGPVDNRIVVIAGKDDAGIAQAAELATNAARIAQIYDAAGHARAFEALFEVTSMRNMNVSSRLIAAGPMNEAPIWRAPVGGF